ncbi:MAG: phage tail protein [Rhodospirillales bacterium]
MAIVKSAKTSFTSGEISPRLLGRADLKAYLNGAAKLRNVFVEPTGGVRRRPGLRFVDKAPGPGRLAAFEFNTEQTYLLVFTDLKISVYHDGAQTAEITTPWTSAHVRQLNWVQSADTILVTHPDIRPKKITRTPVGGWNMEDWTFVEEDNRRFQPMHKFAPAGVTLKPNTTSGAVTLTASAPVFAGGHAGTRLRIQDKEVEITAVVSPTQARAQVKQNLPNASGTKDWEEQAFSAVRGWPASVTFHQDRMVIGGSRDLPNRLWFSKSTDLFNFDLGEGLDDEGIEFAILSDQVNAVRAVFSGRHLQVFTSGGEWMVTGNPLTPSEIQINRQTRIGSRVDRTVPPRDVDGATLFAPRAGRELREFLFADVEQAYQASDLATVSRHLIDHPVDQDFSLENRLFHQVMENGTMASVTIFRAEDVTAWTLQETEGAFKSVAAVGADTYVLVERSGETFIEVFDERCYLDSCLIGDSDAPQTEWRGLSHLEGREVSITAGGSVEASRRVRAGAVTLDEPARSVQAGLGFTHVIEPLPPDAGSARGGVQGGAVRLISVTLRLKDARALKLDTGKGVRAAPFKRFGAGLLDKAPPAFTGDKTVRAFGWTRDGVKPLWRIEQSDPLPFILLSAVTEFAVNG